MVLISELEEETQDIDWFCVDAVGEIAHFASGGRGFLPTSVSSSRVSLEILLQYFRESLAPSTVAIEAASLCQHLQFRSTLEMENYFADFRDVGTRGLYSFDCVTVGPRPSSYFQVVYPQTAVRFENLPGDIREIVVKTKYSGLFREAAVIIRSEVC